MGSIETGFVKLVKREMYKQGINQTEVSRRAGLSGGFLSRVLRGEYKTYSYKHVDAVMKALNMPYAELDNIEQEGKS